MNPFRFIVDALGGFFDRRLWRTVAGYSRTTTARVDVSEDSALNYAAVWCATRLLCGTGSSLPLPMFRSDDGETRDKLRDHPVYRLLNIAPNPEQTAINFRSVMWQWQVNWGNAYAEIVREGNNPLGTVMELWPLHPSRVVPKRYEDGRLYYEVAEFGAPPKELEPSRVLHIPSIITYDGIFGRGVIQHARETIGAGIAAEKRAANTFGAGHVPAVVVEHPGQWKEEARQSFRKEWKEIYGHPDGDEVALLLGGATAKPLGFSATDSQFLESRQFDIEDIARWYGVPPHLLHHLLRATFNNIEELGIDFVRYGMMPWLEVWEQSIRQKLLSESEQTTTFAEHNVDALMRGNAEARGKFYQVMTAAAIMSRNECRRLENLDPVDGGDVYLVQGAMVPLDEDGKPESSFVNPTQPPPGDSTSSTAPDAENIKATVVSSVQRIMARDLSRLLTKESNKMESCAKKPDDFIDRVDEFYASHRVMLMDAVNESATAMNSCGYSVDASALASLWAQEGKSLILDAAGTATPKELPGAVQRVIKSKSWTERPQKAVERASNATPVM